MNVFGNKKKDEVVKHESKVPAVYDMEADAGGGLENIDKESQTIPYVIILQKGTPIADPDNDKYIEGAKAGMFFNTASEELFSGSDGLFVTPCNFNRIYVEKEPGKDGDFISIVQPIDIKVAGAKIVKSSSGRKELLTSEGTELVDTRYHAVLISIDGVNFTPVMLKIKSTQIAKSKQWITALANRKVKGANGMYTPATWCQKYKITTQKESNDKHTWFGYKIEYVGLVDNPKLAMAGKEFHNQVVGGAVKVDRDGDSDSDSNDVPF